MVAQVTTGVEAEISRVIGGIHNLPTPPIVFAQIQKVLNNPNASAQEIASILQEDPAMSAKVLKLTNSAYYGLARAIESVRQAVVIVGLEAIRNLVLSASMFEAFAHAKIDKEFQDNFWRHSLSTAFAARVIARNMQKRRVFDAEAGFSGGLLHDIGKMVISVYMPEDAQRIKSLKAEHPHQPDYKAEEMVLGYNHMKVGALLGEQWRLPAKLTESIKFHHFPQLTETEGNDLPFLVHMANYLSLHTFDNPTDGELYIEPLQEGILEFVGASEEELRNLSIPLRDEYIKAETFMEMAKGTN